MKSKYSNLKIFHYQDKLDSLEKNEKITGPIHVRIKPTNLCNHNCWYCAYKSDNLQLGQDMIEKDFIPLKKMMEIIDDCKAMDIKSITFSGGGEPFTYRYFTETIKKIIDSKISFASLTNGSKLYGEIAELFAYNATWLRISIDGWDNKSYSEYRKVKENSFDKLIENMRNFQRLNGNCALGVSFIVDNKNYNHIFEFSRKMKDIGVNSIKISPCIVDNNGTINNDFHKPFFDLAKEQALRAKQELEDKNFEVNELYHWQTENSEKKYSWCPYSQILPIIGADLNIYPCQDKAYNLENGLIGSIKDIRFKDFWFENKENFFKINPSLHCNNHCVADEKNKMILDYLNVDYKHIGFV